MIEVISALGVLAVLAFSIWFAWVIVVTIPMDMARARNRDPAAWVLVSIFGSPFLAIIILWFVGPSQP